MMGENGEEQIHVIMGERLSGCDTSAEIPSQSVGFMPMMQILWLVWLIVGVLAAVWLWKQIVKNNVDSKA